MTKSVKDCLKCGLSWLYNVTCYLVSINDDGTMIG